MAFPRSGTVDTQTLSGTKDFVFAHSSALQNSNIAANDHLKIDTVDLARGGPSNTLSGGSVKLDTATTYSNSNGAASLGRLSLGGGKFYKLVCNVGYALFSAGAGSVLTLQWFDVTGTPAAIGQPLNVYPASDTANETTLGSLEAMFAPSGGAADVKLVEVRITAATTLTSIGDTAKGLPTILVETY